MGLGGASLWLHRSSLERGNHLYREGQTEGAAAIYRARLDAETGHAASAYNLGTALMTLGSPEAEGYLRTASEAADRAAAQRGHYNLARLFLARAVAAEAPELAVPLLEVAVGSGRSALRLDPLDDDARWNLMLAQHLLDSLSREVDGEEVADDDGGGDRSDGGLVIPEPAQRGTPRGAEREALAGDDPGSLNTAEALALLDVVSTDVEALIRGMLWSLRPDVDPWAQPYPGGAW
jgi:hypothetical protein